MRFDFVSGSISVQVLSPIGTVLADEQAGVRLRGFALAFGRLAKSKYIRFQCKFFRLRLRGLLLIGVVLFVDQVRDELTFFNP